MPNKKRDNVRNGRCSGMNCVFLKELTTEYGTKFDFCMAILRKVNCREDGGHNCDKYIPKEEEKGPARL